MDNLKVGSLLNHYRIVRKIGAGGMGEVYLAEDTHLERRIALKVLPAEVAANEDRVRRFVQEAKAASALNHPNILTVYEIGEIENSRYIATELIKGETLRERLNGEPLNLRETLETALQIAAALNAAHEARIVHRDIKPENIMLRDDGFVKILDFGLAKLTEKKPESFDSEDETRALEVKTSPGTVMGTVLYMSPEQARGKEIDARSDIWSLGVVVYEMLTRRTPFAGETTNDTIAAILTKEPVPLNDDAPKELRRIVRKALQKDKNERYQTIKDFLIDVKNLKRELDFAEELERSASPRSMKSANVGANQNSEQETVAISTANSTRDSSPLTVSSAEYIANQVSSHKIAAALGSIVLLALVGLAAYYFLAKNNSITTAATFEKTKNTKMTKSGKVTVAAISPDGKYFAHVTSDAGQQTLFVRQTSANNDITVIPATKIEYWGITFSKDSNDLFYSVRDASGIATLYKIPALGGTAQKIIERVDCPVTFSPDGKQLAFVRGEFPVKDQSALIIANTDGSGEKILATRKAPEKFYPNYFVGPSWSPDGKMIAATVAGVGSNFNVKVVGFNTGDGTETKITKEEWGYIGRVEWLADGKGLLMVAREVSGSYRQVWYYSYPGGESRLVTNEFADFRNISLNADSTKLVTSSITRMIGTWLAPITNVNQISQIVSPNSEGALGVKWTADGKIIYHNDSPGSSDIWMMESNGSGQKRITSSGDNSFPSVSPDGSMVAYMSKGIWIMGIDGSNPQRLTNDYRDIHPTFTPDGKWIIYYSDNPLGFGLRKVSIEGGTPIRLSEGTFAFPKISPDGKFIAALYLEKRTTFDQLLDKIAILPIDGGAPIKTYSFQNSATVYATIVWSADGKSILYTQIKNSISNIWSQPIAGGQTKQISDFKDSLIFSFDLSPDGKQLVMTRGTTFRDAILISNEK